MIRASVRAFAIVALAAAAGLVTLADAQILAPAASRPTLKRAVTVTGDIVRIGDLIDNAGAAAETAIFRSPDIGTTGAVSVQQVLDAVEPYHIYLVDTGTISEVEVTRAGRTIDLTEIEGRIARAFAGHYGLGDARDLTVTLDVAARPIVIDAAANGDLVLSSAALNQLSGRFEVTFEAPGGSAIHRPLRFTGSVIETVAVAVAVHALKPGTVVKDSDVAVERRPKAQIGAETLGATHEAVGLAVRGPLRAGQPLRRTDLMKPQVVHRDDNVTLVYEVPGILLTTRGKALEAGAEGDVISVLNVQSKRTVQGTVTGPNRVNILTSTASLAIPSARAAALPPSPPQSVASR